MNYFFETLLEIGMVVGIVLFIILVCLSILSIISLPFVGVIALLVWIF
tara:strand:- start:598 stop:741 length:144 start_codon:yes stop_codon:yes gene_type:complete